MFKRIGTLWLVLAVAFAACFLLGILLGWFVPVEAKLTIIEAVLDKFDSILTGSTTNFLLSVNIFINNIVVALLVLLAGMIPFLPVVIVVGNGAIIGVFIDLLWRMNLLQPGSFISGMIGLVPHGLFELSAIFLAASIGTTALLKLIFHKKIQPLQSRLQFLAYSIKWFALVVVPLLIVAAMIEAFISPRVVGQVQNWQEGLFKNNEMSLALNSVLLAQSGCVPGGAETTTTDVSQLDMLYQPDVYALLQQRATASGWVETYTCRNQQPLMISSYDATVWSSDQALALVATFEDEATLTYQVYTTDTKTVVVAYTQLPFAISHVILEPMLTRAF